MSAANIGMMDGAYFVGRNELLAWVNSTLQLSLSRVEEAASGAVHCQLMDSVHPGVVPMHKVNFDARTEYEMIQNYKVLQDIFNKLHIDKHIEVTKLVKGRPLDNLEFMQWIKRYCDSVAFCPNYNATERRETCKGAAAASGSRKVVNSSGCKPTSSRPCTPAVPPRSSGVRSSRQSSAANASSLPTSSHIKALNEQVTDLKLSIDNLEKERDFYFEKLRDIEILCQSAESEGLEIVSAIQKILYATDERHGAEGRHHVNESDYRREDYSRAADEYYEDEDAVSPEDEDADADAEAEADADAAAGGAASIENVPLQVRVSRSGSCSDEFIGSSAAASPVSVQ